ncbi:Hypothetical predicted protein [Octopus vulgaris]|uniref:Uncharacterized protein n=1 Tax=Octopus vulgaris TaxID=6645 RepID=A0AA36AVQ3_OCTVU|nr:Hypothetical predicted protein [Octopus vulgaris]
MMGGDCDGAAAGGRTGIMAMLFVMHYIMSLVNLIQCTTHKRTNCTIVPTGRSTSEQLSCPSAFMKPAPIGNGVSHGICREGENAQKLQIFVLTMHNVYVCGVKAERCQNQRRKPNASAAFSLAIRSEL